MATKITGRTAQGEIIHQRPDGSTFRTTNHSGLADLEITAAAPSAGPGLTSGAPPAPVATSQQQGPAKGVSPQATTPAKPQQLTGAAAVNVFRGEVRQLIAQGMDQVEAAATVARRRPDLHQAVMAAGSPSPAGLATGQPQADAVQQFQALVDQRMRERGSSRQQATAAVARENPDLHRAALQQASDEQERLLGRRAS